MSRPELVTAAWCRHDQLDALAPVLEALQRRLPGVPIRIEPLTNPGATAITRPIARARCAVVVPLALAPCPETDAAVKALVTTARWSVRVAPAVPSGEPAAAAIAELIDRAQVTERDAVVIAAPRDDDPFARAAAWTGLSLGAEFGGGIAVAFGLDGIAPVVQRFRDQGFQRVIVVPHEIVETTFAVQCKAVAADLGALTFKEPLGLQRPMLDALVAQYRRTADRLERARATA